MAIPHWMRAGEQTTQTASSPPLATSIADLRAQGPNGLQRVLGRLDELQAQLASLNETLTQLYANSGENQKEQIAAVEREVVEINAKIEKLQPVIDQVGGQRGCSISRMYWYTDLEQAKAEAVRRHRPILSLRMLGKLTDEYSCANSRFFRTALYSNKELSEFLRTNFVLHWQSVRPVPRVTIDFGDGRKLERTLTGNSAHYILAADGTPLDVLPGLYSPLMFRQQLWNACSFFGTYTAASASDRPALLKSFHQTQAEEALRRWDFDIQSIGEQQAEFVRARINGAIEAAQLAGQPAPAAGIPPKAVKAARQAIGKTMAEAPVLRFAKLGGTWMERGMDDDVWKLIANLHREDTKLDNASIAVIGREFPRAAAASRVAMTKFAQENPLLRLVRTFEDSIALDTVRNEYLLHRRVHEKFIDNDSFVANLDALNEWVYSELFLTPSSDPWLGLAPNDVYTALDNDGRREPAVVDKPGG
jgi:hypothetical protein